MMSADKELLFLDSFVSKTTGPMKVRDMYSKFKSWATEFGGVSDEKFLRNSVAFSIYLKRVPGIVYTTDRSHGAGVSFDYARLKEHLKSVGVDSEVAYLFEAEKPAEVEVYSGDY